MNNERTTAYIDGFNLYYGLRTRGWSQFYWIDPFKLVESLLVGGRELASVKYFTARVREPDDKRQRQTAYLDAIRASSDAEIILGKFYKKTKTCRSCKSSWSTHEEKMTDSAIASHLVADAFLGAFDTALIIGGDTDIVPAVKMVRRHFPKKRIEVWFPPRRKNLEVAASCHDEGNINGNHLKAAMMPDVIEVDPSVTIRRPPTWT